MCESASPLPDDLALCHEIIRQQAETIRESRRRIEQLEHQVELLHRRQFGPRRESVDPAQLRLFSEDASDEFAEETGEKPPEPEEAKPKRRWRRTGRQKLRVLPASVQKMIPQRRLASSGSARRRSLGGAQ